MKNWGWVLPTMMIPVLIAAGKYWFVPRTEYISNQKSFIEDLKSSRNESLRRIDLLETTVQIFRMHVENDEIHMSYRERAKQFIPRQELQPTLDELKQGQRYIIEKLDRTLEERSVKQ